MLYGKGSPTESRPFPVVVFRVGSDSTLYYASLDKNILFRNWKIGDSAKIIYDPSIPGEASYYSFPYYWIGLIEVWAGLFVLAFIFIVAGTQNFI
ncbi:hypothetical protein [Lacibacter luteus]|nr:hypothetical protein [Lacibacter luteus]